MTGELKLSAEAANATTGKTFSVVVIIMQLSVEQTGGRCRGTCGTGKTGQDLGMILITRDCLRH